MDSDITWEELNKTLGQNGGEGIWWCSPAAWELKKRNGPTQVASDTADLAKMFGVAIKDNWECIYMVSEDGVYESS